MRYQRLRRRDQALEAHPQKLAVAGYSQVCAFLDNRHTKSLESLQKNAFLIATSRGAALPSFVSRFERFSPHAALRVRSAAIAEKLRPSSCKCASRCV